MPFPPNILRTNIRASLIGGEQMVHTVHWRLPGATADPEATAREAARLVRDGWASLLAAGTPALTDVLYRDTIYTSVDAYILDAQGRATAQGLSGFLETARGSSTAAVPNEVACAVTLSTSRAGRTGRGRVYMGGLATPWMTNTGRFDPARCLALANAWRNWVQGMNNPSQGVPLVQVVVSRTTGIASPVTEIRVGDVPDVQRRRRNRLRETYSTAQVAS